MLARKFGGMVLLALALVLPLGGCDDKPAAPETLTPELSAQLEQRVRERWQTLVDRDFEKTWAFSTPNFREVFPKHLYVRNFSYGVEWELTGVEIVNYDGQAAVASVAARVMSKSVNPTSRASKLIGAVPMTVTERWIFIDGQWWYSANV